MRSIVCNVAAAIFLALQERPVVDAGGLVGEGYFGVPMIALCDYIEAEANLAAISIA